MFAAVTRAFGASLAPAVTIMLITGAANSILMKAMVIQKAPERPGGEPVIFDHPVLQTLFMMIGELLCLVVIFFSPQACTYAWEQIQGLKGARWFALPVLMDASATTLVNVAYLSIPVSLIQMLRGGVVVFSCLFSWLLMNKRQSLREAWGVLLVFVGITLVGLAALRRDNSAPTMVATPPPATAAAFVEHSAAQMSLLQLLSSASVTSSSQASRFLSADDGAPDAPGAASAAAGPVSTGSSLAAYALLPAVGVSLCALATAFQALQLVVEEHVLKNQLRSVPIPPMLVVGMEGTFGTLLLLALLPALQQADPLPAALFQLSTSTILMLLVGASIVSIALFNASGVVITQRASSVARSTIDTSRTLLVWGTELALGWNSFCWVQLAGFVLVVYGTAEYNGMFGRWRSDVEAEAAEDGTAEETAALLANKLGGAAEAKAVVALE